MKKTDDKAKGRLKAIVPEVVDGGTYSELVNAIGGLLERARSKIAAVANFELVRTYWETGRYIVEYEQHGSDRAKYGVGLIVNLARDLRVRLGRGYSRTNLIYMRKLYQTFRKSQTLSDLLSWSHYLEILQCTDMNSQGRSKRSPVVQNRRIRQSRARRRKPSRRNEFQSSINTQLMTAVLTNLCMLQDAKARVLVQD